MKNSSAPDAVTLEIFRHLFTALAEEMGAALKRASFSPNIKERRDYSCALFNPEAAAVSLGDHMPVHLGAMPMSVEAALSELGALAPGDVVCLNDPFKGGTHLPDITLISPIHSSNGRLLGYVASRAHHSDVGGSTPGSMPLAREIYEEGVRIPPVRLYKEGTRNEDLWITILANVRTPDERGGDLDAQLAALHTGTTRLLEIAERRGVDETLAAMDALIAYADRLVKAGLELIPDGTYHAEDAIEDDGFGSGPVPIKATMTVAGNSLTIDFAGSSPQVPGGVNAVAAITSSATRYVVRCVVEALLGEPLPAGGGSMSAVELKLPEGSIVNARPPASVAAGNVETSQRITDVAHSGLRQGASGPNACPLARHYEQHDGRGHRPADRSALRVLRDGRGRNGRGSRPGLGYPRCTATCRTRSIHPSKHSSTHIRIGSHSMESDAVPGVTGSIPEATASVGT